MGNIAIRCTDADMQWIAAAIQTYDNEFAGTPPWAGDVIHGDPEYYDKTVGAINWEIQETNIEPLKCPECNGDFVTMIAEYNEFPKEANGFYIECKTCGARTGFHRKKEGAIKSWNRKAAARME